MAWRPGEYLLDGELDNTTPGKVTGWIRFAGMKEKVTIELQGDFHRDIRGTKIRLRGEEGKADSNASVYLNGFAPHQTGKVGDITAGFPLKADTLYPYIEWYSEQNDRVVLELKPEQVYFETDSGRYDGRGRTIAEDRSSGSS